MSPVFVLSKSETGTKSKPSAQKQSGLQRVLLQYLLPFDVLRVEAIIILKRGVGETSGDEPVVIPLSLGPVSVGSNISDVRPSMQSWSNLYYCWLVKQTFAHLPKHRNKRRTHEKQKQQEEFGLAWSGVVEVNRIDFIIVKEIRLYPHPVSRILSHLCHNRFVSQQHAVHPASDVNLSDDETENSIDSAELTSLYICDANEQIVEYKEQQIAKISSLTAGWCFARSGFTTEVALHEVNRGQRDSHSLRFENKWLRVHSHIGERRLNVAVLCMQKDLQGLVQTESFLMRQAGHAVQIIDVPSRVNGELSCDIGSKWQKLNQARNEIFHSDAAIFIISNAFVNSVSITVAFMLIV